MDEFTVAFLNTFSEEVEPGVNMLGTGVMFGVPRKTFGTLVINVDWNGRIWL